MNYLSISVILLCLAVVFVIAVLFVKRNFLIYTLIALVLVGGILGTIGFRYFTNQSFKLSVDLKFNQAKQHDDLSNKNIPSLPLPEHTAFVYRYSEEGAKYYTAKSKDEIIKYFSEISDKDTFIKSVSSEDNKEKLKLKYKNTLYTVIIEKSISPQGNYLYIDSNTKTL